MLESDWERLGPLDGGGAGALFQVRSTAESARGLLRTVPCYVAEAEAFAAEIDVLSELSDPALPRVLDSGATAEEVWAVLEHVEGESLEQRLRAGPLPWAKVVALGRELARGIGRVHDLGGSARSVSVDHVVLTRGGARLTRIGVASGAPDVAVDQHADVRALVRVLVFAASGVRPPVNAVPYDPGSSAPRALRAFFTRWTGLEAEAAQRPMSALHDELMLLRLGPSKLMRGCLITVALLVAVALAGVGVTYGGVQVLREQLDQLMTSIESQLAAEAAQRDAGGPNVVRPAPETPAPVAVQGGLTRPKAAAPSPPSPPAAAAVVVASDPGAAPVAAVGETVVFHARPEGAAVWIDGEQVGVTPLTLSLPRGRYAVRMTRTDGTRVEQRVRVAKGGGTFAWQGGASLDEWAP